MHQLPTEVSGVGGRGGARIGKIASLLAIVGALAVTLVVAASTASAAAGLPEQACIDSTLTEPLPTDLTPEGVAFFQQILQDGVYYSVLINGQRFLATQGFVDANPGVTIVAKHSIAAGACAGKPPPGPPGMKLCNVNWPSDPPIVVPGPDPSNPTAGDTARAAVAGGDWRYAYLLKQGGKVTFTCVLPANAVATGMVADDNDDEIPASLAQSFAAAGIGETFAYNVYTVSA